MSKYKFYLSLDSILELLSLTFRYLIDAMCVRRMLKTEVEINLRQFFFRFALSKIFAFRFEAI